MLESIGQRVREIQSSSEGVKRWWVISSSVIVGVITVAIWSSYIQSTLTLPEPFKQVPATTTPIAESITPGSGEGILGTLGKGSQVVYDNAVSGLTSLSKWVVLATLSAWNDTVGWVSSIFRSRREFSIEPEVPTFVPQTPNDPIPPTPINSNR